MYESNFESLCMYFLRTSVSKILNLKDVCFTTNCCIQVVGFQFSSWGTPALTSIPWSSGAFE